MIAARPHSCPSVLPAFPAFPLLPPAHLALILLCLTSYKFMAGRAGSCKPPTWYFVARRSRRHSAAHTPSFRRSPGRSMQSHRDWLLSQHGSVCAYCGTETPDDTITLDHVRPRRGQTAYDRPDNLVLACRDCNAAKADTPLVAFLMQRRARGVFLLHYGEHLSEPLQGVGANRPPNGLSPTGSNEAQKGGPSGRPFNFHALPVPSSLAFPRLCSWR